MWVVVEVGLRIKGGVRVWDRWGGVRGGGLCGGVGGVGVRGGLGGVRKVGWSGSENIIVPTSAGPFEVCATIPKQLSTEFRG